VAGRRTSVIERTRFGDEGSGHRAEWQLTQGDGPRNWAAEQRRPPRFSVPFLDDVTAPKAFVSRCSQAPVAAPRCPPRRGGAVPLR